VRFQERFQRYQEATDIRRAERQRDAMDRAKHHPISPEWLAYCINQAVGDDDIIMNESVSNRHVVGRQLHRTQPGTLFQVGGSGLGWGLGTALGAKLASPDKTVVCITTDGSFIFGQPLPALWASNNYNIPFLTILFNNQQYNAVKRSIIGSYGNNSYTATKGKWQGVEFTPPDFAQVSRACGVWGERVDDPDKLLQTIKDALTRVRGGQSAVLDVWLEKP
jgi:acetolactate synthase-1/2/3 large subunit